MTERRNRLMVIYRRFFHIIYFLLTFVVIYTFYPKQGKFKYEFYKGKPWLQENIIAPFDFPILKSKQEIEEEKDSLLKNYVPYFTFNPAVETEQIVLLGNELDVFFQSINSSDIRKDQVKELLYEKISEYYNRGILENSISSYKILDGKSHLYLVENNMANKVPVESVLSLKTAYILANEQIKELSLNNDLLLSFIKNFDVNKILVPNMHYDEAANEARITEMVNNIAVSRGIVESGTRIISKGEMVTPENFNILDSYKQTYLQKRKYGGWFTMSMIGNMLLVLILMVLMVFYLRSFNNTLFLQKRNYSLILTVVMITFLSTRIVYSTPGLSIYILPFCILPVVIRTFLGARMAIFIHLITMIIVSDMADNSLEFVFMQLVVGTIAVISLNKLHRRSNLIITTGTVMLAYVVVSVAFMMAKEGEITLDMMKHHAWILISSLLLLLAYPIIYLFERIFGFTSDVTLIELSDTNHPLLRKLAEEAPGTFQHSMQVANLAEEAVIRTSGNPLLVRTGALYHDVGKMVNAQYFIENQTPGINPHDKLDFVGSARRIISHVNDGVALARKYRIPEPIIDFIRMHHGKSMAKYFYLKYKEANPNNAVTESDFTYPGPNPISRETAILMLADGVEAASRSLPVKNEETLQRIIDLIIDAKVHNRELDDAPLTFKDVKDIKRIFLSKLKTIYHVRIEYPEEKERFDNTDRD